MELEISVEDLLSKRKIESDRIEFKTGWNPDDIYRSYEKPNFMKSRHRTSLIFKEFGALHLYDENGEKKGV